MSTNANERYQSVKSLKEDVQNYLSGYSTEAEGAGFIKESTLFYKRNKLLCNISIISLLTIGIVTMGFISRLQSAVEQSEKERDRADQNLSKLRVEKKKVEDEKKKVDQNLALFESEREWTTSIIKQNTNAIHKSVYVYTDWMIYSDPKEAVEKSLDYLKRMIASKPEYQWSYMQTGYTYFIMHDFKKACQFFEQYRRSTTDLYEVAKKNLDLKKVNGSIPVKNLIEIFTEIGFQKRFPEIIKMLVYDGQTRKSKADHAKLVKFVLRNINKRWKGKMTYNEEMKYLKIAGKGFYRSGIDGRRVKQQGPLFNTFIPLLKDLKIKHLNISKTSVASLNFINNLKLETLDISHTNIEELDALMNMESLKKLIISKDQFIKKKLKKVPKHIDIIIEN